MLYGRDLKEWKYKNKKWKSSDKEYNHYTYGRDLSKPPGWIAGWETYTLYCNVALSVSPSRL